MVKILKAEKTQLAIASLSQRISRVLVIGYTTYCRSVAPVAKRNRVVFAYCLLRKNETIFMILVIPAKGAAKQMRTLYITQPPLMPSAIYLTSGFVTCRLKIRTSVRLQDCVAGICPKGSRPSEPRLIPLIQNLTEYQPRAPPRRRRKCVPKPPKFLMPSRPCFL